MTTSAPHVAPEIVAGAVLAHLTQTESYNSPSWRLAGQPRLMHKPWSTLYFLSVLNAEKRCDLVAKIIRFPDQQFAEFSWQSEELLIRGRREYETMTRVFNHFASDSSSLLSAPRPVAYLSHINAILMEFVTGTALYNECFDPRQWLTRSGQRRAQRIVARTGHWLRRFHHLPLGKVAAGYSFGPGDTFQALLKETDRLRLLGVNIDRFPLWPQTLTALQNVNDEHRVWTHGDFHMRNVMVLPDEGILGFDTALERVDSPYADLGKFVADLRTRRALILSRGLLPPPDFVQSLARVFLSGYLAGDKFDFFLLALYEGFFIFQKWSESLAAIQEKFSGPALKPFGAGLRAAVVNPTFNFIAGQWMRRVAAAVEPDLTPGIPRVAL